MTRGFLGPVGGAVEVGGGLAQRSGPVVAVVRMKLSWMWVASQLRWAPKYTPIVAHVKGRCGAAAASAASLAFWA